jgi:hypothetical protein
VNFPNEIVHDGNASVFFDVAEGKFIVLLDLESFIESRLAIIENRCGLSTQWLLMSSVDSPDTVRCSRLTAYKGKRRFLDLAMKGRIIADVGGIPVGNRSILQTPDTEPLIGHQDFKNVPSHLALIRLG